MMELKRIPRFPNAVWRDFQQTPILKVNIDGENKTILWSQDGWKFVYEPKGQVAISDENIKVINDYLFPCFYPPYLLMIALASHVDYKIDGAKITFDMGGFLNHINEEVTKKLVLDLKKLRLDV